MAAAPSAETYRANGARSPQSMSISHRAIAPLETPALLLECSARKASGGTHCAAREGEVEEMARLSPEAMLHSESDGNLAGACQNVAVLSEATGWERELLGTAVVFGSFATKAPGGEESRKSNCRHSDSPFQGPRPVALSAFWNSAS
jgi:hypothetical protein